MKKGLYLIFLAITILMPIVSFSQVLFQIGQSLATGAEPLVVCIGDINNDGREDIVTATGHDSNTPFQYRISVYIQSSSGTFPSTQVYPYGPYPEINSMGIKDVNNDSLNDLIVGIGDSIAIYFQNASGTLNPKITYYSGISVDDLKAGDVNNDGLTDIVVCHWAWNANFIRVFYQTSTSFTTSTYPKPSGGYDEIEIGDVNSDGLNDVVYMAGQGAGGIHVFIQNGSGTLNNYVSYFPEPSSTESLNGFAIADLNSDGANDVIVTKGGNVPYAFISIWYQDTLTHLLSTPSSIPSNQVPEEIDVADFNCDGKPEIFINHGGFDNISVWTADSSGNYSTYDNYHVSVAYHPLPEALASGDINNDGRLDIVTVGGTNTIQLMYNVSLPTTFTSIDTIITVDTITHNSPSDVYFTTVSIDTNLQFIVTQTDSFLVSNHSQDSIRTQSFITRQGNVCSFPYSDNISTFSYSFYETEDTDTSFWSTTLDSSIVLNIKLEIDLDIQVFPNPFDSQFTILCRGSEPTTIYLFDLLGQPVLQHTFMNSAIINTEHLSDGIYFYQLSKYGMKAGKIVKQ